MQISLTDEGSAYLKRKKREVITRFLAFPLLSGILLILVYARPNRHMYSYYILVIAIIVWGTIARPYFINKVLKKAITGMNYDNELVKAQIQLNPYTIKRDLNQPEVLLTNSVLYRSYFSIEKKNIFRCPVYILKLDDKQLILVPKYLDGFETFLKEMNGKKRLQFSEKSLSING